MKVTKYVFLPLVFLTYFSFGQGHVEHADEENTDHHCFFENKPTSVGVSGIHSFGLNSTGLNMRIYHNIGKHICFGPEYAFIKHDDTEIASFDFVVHYIFETPWVGIYPLIGANYTVEKESHGETIETISEPGIVLGAGMHRNVKSVTFFAEYSRVELGISDQFLALGVMYSF